MGPLSLGERARVRVNEMLSSFTSEASFKLGKAKIDRSRFPVGGLRFPRLQGVDSPGNLRYLDVWAASSAG